VADYDLLVESGGGYSLEVIGDGQYELFVEGAAGADVVLEVGGQQGVPGIPGPSGSALGVVDHPFGWGDASPLAITTIPAGSTVISIEVVISQGFNGTGAALSLGVSGTPDLLVGTGDVAPGQVAVYGVSPCVRFDVDTPVIFSITPGVGASAGSGIIRIFLSIN
jgi:hypothetical protein